MPFFSIVIPALNEEKYLPKLLKSLSSQIDKDFDVTLVDGNSEDKTIAIAQKFKNCLPLNIINSPVRNVSHQRNIGAKSSEGKYIVFLDADTITPSNFLSEIHHYLNENADCQFLTTWIEPDSNNSSDKLLATITNFSFELAKAAEKQITGGFDIIIKRQTFNKIGGFNPELKIAEDYDISQRLQKIGVKLHFLKNVRLTISFRRFRREGTLNILRKYAIANVKFFLEGPITQEIFDYPMGGKVPVPKNKQKKVKLEQTIKKYLKALNLSSSL